MFLKPVQHHSEAGSDACLDVTGSVLCQPEHRRLQVVGLQPCPAVSQAGLHELGSRDGGPLPVAEVASSDHLSPGEGQPPLEDKRGIRGPLGQFIQKFLRCRFFGCG